MKVRPRRRSSQRSRRPLFQLLPLESRLLLSVTYSHLIPFQNELYYAAQDSGTQLGLWAESPSTSPRPVFTGLNPVAENSPNYSFVELPNSLLFATSTGRLYQTDGTPAGTVRYPGGVSFSPGMGLPGGRFDQPFYALNDIYFAAGPLNNTQYYRLNLNPTVDPASPSLFQINANGGALYKPTLVTEYQGSLLVAANSLGGNTPTSKLFLGGQDYPQELATIPFQNSPAPFSRIGPRILLNTTPNTFLSTDGTVAGTFNLDFGPNTRLASNLVEFNSSHYLVVEHNNRWELWSTDGTNSGSAFAADLGPVNSATGATVQLIAANSRIYFNLPREVTLSGQTTLVPTLGITDATTLGTSDIFFQSADFAIGPNALTVGDQLFWTHSTSANLHYFATSDGTTIGTRKIYTAPNASTHLAELTPLLSSIYFTEVTGNATDGKLLRYDISNDSLHTPTLAYSQQTPTISVQLPNSLTWEYTSYRRFIATVTTPLGTANGTFTITTPDVPSFSQAAPVIDGTGYMDLSNLIPGTHSLVFTFTPNSGDTLLLPATAASNPTVSILPSDPGFALSISTTKGAPVLSAFRQLYGPYAQGTVVFYIDNILVGSSSPTSNLAQLEVNKSFALGAHTAKAVYSGDDGYLPQTIEEPFTLNAVAYGQLTTQDVLIVSRNLPLLIHATFTSQPALSADMFSPTGINVYLSTLNGRTLALSLASFQNIPNTAQSQATFLITPPAGGWQEEDFGLYYFEVNGNIPGYANSIPDFSKNRGAFFLRSDTISPLFDDARYLSLYPDVAAAVTAGTFTSALQHFLAAGQYEGRSPNVLFDEAYYRAHNPDVAAAISAGALPSGFAHFANFGQFENRRPSLAFDPAFLVERYPPIATQFLQDEGFISATDYFLQRGFANDILMPNRFFNSSDYLHYNPDVAAALSSHLIGSAIEHYVLYGVHENRRTSAFFDPAYYAQQNPDVVAAVNAGSFPTLFDHFLSYGLSEKRAALPQFDEAFYLTANPDVSPAVTSGALLSGFDHFIRYGARTERRDPSPTFNTANYISAHPTILTQIANAEFESVFSAYIQSLS